jgi:hypothetical protein
MPNLQKNSLVVEGIEDKISTAELRRLFEQVGALTSLNVATLPDGTKYGLVVMARAEDASDAILKFNGTHHRGVVMRVKFSQSTGTTSTT